MKATLLNLSFIILFWLHVSNAQATRIIQTDYGTFSVSEPVLEELFDHPVIERLKSVRQYGVIYYSEPKGNDYNRHEHSVGVWAILRGHGAGLEEQIAGLLHDVSHTVFSHVGDYLFKHKSEKNSYQDDIFEWYLKKQGVDKVLEKHGFTMKQVNPKNGNLSMLESDIPDLSADRIEYNLKAGLLTEKLTKKDVELLVNNLVFEHGRWYFKDQALVKTLCEVSLYHTVHIWGGFDSFMLDVWTSNALQRALDTGLLSLDDVHFSVDDVVWKTLCASNDLLIRDCITKIVNPTRYFSRSTSGQGDIVIRPKFRGIDPWIKQGDFFRRLTEIDENYAKEYNRVKIAVVQGFPIKLV